MFKEGGKKQTKTNCERGGFVDVDWCRAENVTLTLLLMLRHFPTLGHAKISKNNKNLGEKKKKNILFMRGYYLNNNLSSCVINFNNIFH